MTTSYHPEYESVNDRDTHAHSYSDYVEDDDADKMPHHRAHDHDDASFSSTTRTLSGVASSTLSTPPNIEVHGAGTHSATSSPDGCSANKSFRTKFPKNASSPALSTSLPSSSAASPARISTPSFTARRKTYTMGKVEKIISITPVCYLKPKCFFVAWNSGISSFYNQWIVTVMILCAAQWSLWSSPDGLSPLIPWNRWWPLHSPQLILNDSLCP